MTRLLEKNVRELSDAELDAITGGECAAPPFTGNVWKDLSCVLGGNKGLDTLGEMADSRC